MAADIEKIKADQFEIQRAIKFLTDHILDLDGQQIPLKTDKPLLMHCLRVGMTLYEHNYDLPLVIAGILHDINEDAGVSFDRIEQSFGTQVRDLVHALTYDQSIPEGPERIQDAHERKRAGGREAIIVSIADHLANLPYIHFVSDPVTHNNLIKKHQDFLHNFCQELTHEPIYAVYNQQLDSYPLL